MSTAFTETFADQLLGRGTAIWRGMSHLFIDAYLFARFSAFSFSGILPLLGATLSSRPPNIGVILGLVAVALSFHCFAYVLNDVVDLPLDSTEPLRSQYPLVRGSVSRKFGAVFSIGQIPLCLALTSLLTGNAGAYGLLIAGFLLMAFYDLFGKRLHFAPLADYSQGGAWTALLLYGSVVSSSSITFSVLTASMFVTIFIAMVNGIHGGLRDLESDFAYGVRSTAILFGARPDRVTNTTIPHSLQYYCISLQFFLMTILILPVLLNWLSASRTETAALLIILVGLCLLSVHLLLESKKFISQRTALVRLGKSHIVVSLASLLAFSAPYLTIYTALAVGLVFFVPLLANGWCKEVAQLSLRVVSVKKGPAARSLER